MSFTYPLGAKVLSEFFGTCLTVFFGESVIANEVLNSTKGHGMGYVGVAIGFGLSFGVSIAWFGSISAHVNPAMFLFLALLGKVEWKEFFACALAEFAGAFVGGVLVFIFFLPHFGFTLPLLSNVSETATFLEGPVSMETNAGRFASAFGPASRPRRGETIRTEMRSLFHLPTDEHFLEAAGKQAHADAELLKKMEMRHERRQQATHTADFSHLAFFDNNSVNLAVLARERDPKAMEMAVHTEDEVRHSVHVGGLLHRHDERLQQSSNEENITSGINRSNSGSAVANDEGVPEADIIKSNDTNETTVDLESPKDYNQSEEDGGAMEAYKAALRADASAKLSIFGTRPAIFNRPYNFLQEALATTVLVVGAGLFDLRQETDMEATGVPPVDGPYFVSFYVSLFITLLILGLGGTTGLAANPARDFGPRLAHQLLPIPGKGPSEWNYGLVVPFWGPFAGAALGAGIFKIMEAMFDMAEIVDAAGGLEL